MNNPKPSTPTTHSNSDISRDSPATTPSTHKDEGMEIPTESASVLDVRILPVAQRYPYMFSQPHFELLISKRWVSAFTRACEGIDSLLGEDTRGFHWRLLMEDEGIPYWNWKLDDEFNHCLVLDRTLTETKVRIVNPPRDPHNDLRHAIQRVVNRGRIEARRAGESVQREGDAS
jgi:hypothetical protein